MTNLERANTSDIPYSPQAQALLLELKDEFPFEKFEAWIKPQLSVGGGHILQFLMEVMPRVKAEAIDPNMEHIDPEDVPF